jgi:hypothetical protein
VPVVPSFALFEIRKDPLTVPELDIVKIAAEDVALLPDAAADHAAVCRNPSLYAGAKVGPASFHPACDAAVSAAAIAEYDVELISPKYHVVI